MKLSLAQAAVGAFALAFAAARSARAEVFDFSYSFSTFDTADFPSGYTSASGTFTATDEGGGQFLVTGASGTWNGETITGVAALKSEGGNDNLLFPFSVPVLDSYGVAFTVSGPIAGDQGSGIVNVFNVTHGYTDASSRGGFSPIFNLAEVSAAVPEPASLAVLGTGLCAVIALRRRPRNVAP